VTPQLTALSVRDLPERDDFPFSVPSIASLRELEFSSPVTLLVGENGSGKSTLLEALAIATKLPTVGSQSAAMDRTLEPQRRLARELRLTWKGRSHRGFFLRAEDFFGFAKRIQEMKEQFQREQREMAEKFRDHSIQARMLAQGPSRRSYAELQERYGDLDAQSHGESFLHLFQSRLVPKGLFLMDEPEAALSPQSQLAFLAMIKDSIDDGSQFVIATHSPILMAIPGATILSFDRMPIAPVAYGELEHVALLRDFLDSPEAFLRHLWS